MNFLIKQLTKKTKGLLKKNHNTIISDDVSGSFSITWDLSKEENQRDEDSGKSIDDRHQNT